MNYHFSYGQLKAYSGNWILVMLSELSHLPEPDMRLKPIYVFSM
jgi:hypothetical protein